MHIKIKKYQNISRIIRNIALSVVLMFLYFSCSFFKKVQDQDINDNNEVVLEWNDEKTGEEKDEEIITHDSNTGEKAVESFEVAEINKVEAEEPETENTEPTLDYGVYTKTFGYELNGDESIELLAEINDWLGTPYRYGSRVKQKGTDCSGFVGSVYKAVYDITLSRSSSAMYNDVKTIKKEDLQEGDIIFFKINGKTISHVGIYISNNKFAHASVNRGVVINDLDENYYKQRFFCGGRIE